MPTFFRHFVDNLGSVILALLLAFAVWIAATLQSDPFVTEVLVNVPITTVNQPEDTVIFEPIVERARVEVRAPESVVRDLDVSSFQATMDLSSVQPGIPSPVVVQIASSNDAVRLQGVNPATQMVHLEAIQVITLEVSLEVQGEPSTGYQASSPVVTPRTVSILGPAPYVSSVVSVTASVSIDGAKEDVTERIKVAPRDADGRLATNLQWTPDQVEASIQIRRRVGFKPDVEVVPDLQVTPAEGYRLGSVSVEPSVVTLKGPPSVLDSLPGFVKTLPVSATQMKVNLVQQTPLTVPVSVAVVNVNFVTVTVEVLPIRSSRTMTVPVEARGVPAEWTVTFSPDVVDVLLEGPDTVLSGLLPGDIQILLNLYDYPLGVHRVAPIVLAPGDITVASVIPETIEVVLERPKEPLVPTDTLRLDELP